MRSRVVGVVLVLLALVIGAVLFDARSSEESGRAGQEATAAEPRGAGEDAEQEGGPRAGAQEVQEEQNVTGERLEALAAA